MACTFTVQTGGDAQPMFQTGQDVLQIFLHSFGAARQVDDERFAAEDAGCTAEHPARGDAQAVVPHGLGDAGHVAVGHGKGGLRGDIPGCKAGAAGGEDQVHLTGIRKAQQLGFELGGIVRQVIPAFRISDEAIDKDVALMERLGVEVKCGAPAPSVAELKKMGYTHILMATGAWKPGKLDIEGNVQGVIEWMKRMKKQVKPCLSGNIVVVGAGNTAMDAARVAKRMGAHATILYRRTKKFMPADEHELQLAIDEGVEFIELAAPVK